MKIITPILSIPAKILSYLFIPLVIVWTALVAGWQLSIVKVDKRWDKEKE